MAKIAFIQEEIRERFGVMILSAVLKNGGHKCEVFIEKNNKNFIEEVKNYQPDIIAFSTMTPGIKIALDFASRLRKVSDGYIIMGGPHPTFYPEVINEDCLDIICRGEGEYALLELADRLDGKREFTDIKNLWVKKDGNIYKNELRELADVEQLPRYDWSLYYEKYPELKAALTKKIFIVRGCPFNCTYCFNQAMQKMSEGKGKYVRFMSVDKAISEIKYLKDQYGMKWLQINGDTINVYRDWFMEFLDRYKKEINVPFLCNVRIDLVDEEMVKKMKWAGCDRADYGIEHGDEEIRRKVLNRFMTDEQIINGGRLFNKYKIRVHTANIIGLPHETISTAWKTIEINRKVKPERAMCFILQPYPGTEINRYSIEAGFLDRNYGFSNSGTGFQIDFDGSKEAMPLKLKDEKKLINIFYFFDLLVQIPWLEKLVKLLINLPPNRFFKAVYVFPVIRQDIKYSNSLRKKIESLLKLVKIIFFGK